MAQPRMSRLRRPPGGRILDELTSLMKRNPTMDVAMKSVLSADLINKLSEDTKSVQKMSVEPETQETETA